MPLKVLQSADLLCRDPRLWASFGAYSPSTDDAVGLVQMHDLAAGHSWFDLTQYRLCGTDLIVYRVLR